MFRCIMRAASVVLIVAVVGVSPTRAGDLFKKLSAIKEPIDAVFHRQPPLTGCDGDVELLAREIDWLEHHIDCYGTVVAKQPDVWGQSRLTAHRYDFETQMAGRLDQFQVLMNGSLQRSDQAYLAMAFALQSAASGSTAPDGATTTTQLNTMLTGGSDGTATVSRTAPFGA